MDAVPEGTVGLPPRAPRPRQGADPAGPARRDRAAQHRQLRDPDRHQGGARLPRRPGRRGDRLRPAPRAGRRRRPQRLPRGLRGRLRGNLQRPRRPPLRHPGPGHPRPQLGHVLRHRAGGLRGLRRGPAQQLRPPGRHLRHPRGRAPGDRDRPAPPRARARARRHPPRLRRPRVPEHRGPEDPRRRGLREDRHRGQQRPRRARHRQPQGAGCGHRRLGRGDPSRDRRRPARARGASTSSPRCASRASPGSTGSRSPSRRSRPPPPGFSRSGGSRPQTGFLADVIYDEEQGLPEDPVRRRSGGPHAAQAPRSGDTLRPTSSCRSCAPAGWSTTAPSLEAIRDRSGRAGRAAPPRASGDSCTRTSTRWGSPRSSRSSRPAWSWRRGGWTADPVARATG